MAEQETALFAMGCFWKPDALFSKLPGVERVTVGYSGGKTERPTYEAVCGGSTGHAETVQVVFNPDVITYRQLLDSFWKHHDPTTLNRQGPDVGEQYRSIIFYMDDIQKSIAEESLKHAQEKYSNTIVTSIEKADTFYPAEEYHQKYLKKQGIDE